MTLGALNRGGIFSSPSRLSHFFLCEYLSFEFLSAISARVSDGICHAAPLRIAKRPIKMDNAASRKGGEMIFLHPRAVAMLRCKF